MKHSRVAAVTICRSEEDLIEVGREGEVSATLKAQFDS